ncbi:unnamed protein product [Amoebophrya sp. A25]|nr:unnamed protein product [Amoebophrya sp. A25]|eukprot:GSA25T00008588001.1
MYASIFLAVLVMTGESSSDIFSSNISNVTLHQSHIVVVAIVCVKKSY